MNRTRAAVVMAVNLVVIACVQMVVTSVVMVKLKIIYRCSRTWLSD